MSELGHFSLSIGANQLVAEAAPMVQVHFQPRKPWLTPMANESPSGSALAIYLHIAYLKLISKFGHS